MTSRRENHIVCCIFGVALWVSAAQCGVSMPEVPDKWSGNVAVMLYDSVEIDVVSRGQENVADIREICWYRVQHNAPCDLREIRFWDFEFTEDRPKIRVVTFDSSGNAETVGDGHVTRERTSELPDARYNLYVDKTGAFLSAVTIPSFDKVKYIRTEIRRTKVRPVFLDRVVLRTAYPTLSKVVRVRLPTALSAAVGLDNGEGVRADSNRTIDGATVVVTYSARLLDPVPEKGVVYPETWFAGVYFRLPPRGTALFSWKDIGDLYLDMIQTKPRPSSALDSIAAHLPSQTSRIAAVAFDYVKQHLRYYGSWEGKRGFVPRDCGEVLAKGYGDCKELSMVLCALLTAKGIGAYPALVSSRSTFVQMNTAFPNLGVFNHMIVAVKDGDAFKYLDPTMTPATSKNSYFGVLNRKTLVLRRNGSFVDSVGPPPGYVNNVVTESSVTQDPDGRWRIHGVIRQQGLCAFRLLHELSGRLSYSEDAILSNNVRVAFGIRTVSVKVESRSQDSVCISFSGDFDEYATRVPNLGFILEVPTLHRGFVMEDRDVSEGPMETPRFSQRDSWLFPRGMTRTSFNACAQPAAEGAWQIRGDTIVRQFTSRRTVYLSASTPECRTLVRERNRFEKASIWKE